MNFLCDNCKQKYHVDDEKLRGRPVTRFKCKKCSHVIEIQASSVPAEGSSDNSGMSAAPMPSEPPAPAPRTPARARPATLAGAQVAPISAAAAGASPAGAARPAPRVRSATTTGPAFGAGAAPRTPSTAAPRGPLAPSAARNAASGPSAAAILNASETGWYAGIRDLPVGPLARKDLIAKVQSGDVTADTLVWREGLDDWRPLRNVAELGDLLRIASQRMSGNLLDEMGKKAPAEKPTGPSKPAARAAPGAKVVPIGAGHKHPLSTARPMLHDDDEEATRITGVDPAIALALMASMKPLAPVESAHNELLEEAPGERTMVESTATPPPAPVTARAPSERPPPPAPPAKALSERPPPPKPEAKVEAKPEPPAPPAPATEDELPEDLFASAKAAPVLAAPMAPSGLGPLMTPSLAPGAPSMAPPPATPVMTAPLAPMAPAAPAVAPVAVQPPREEKKGLPVAVMMLFGGGMLVAGVAGGIVLSRQNQQPPAPAPVVAAPVVAPTPAPAPTPPPAPTPAPTVAEATPPPAEPEAAPAPNMAGDPAHTAAARPHHPNAPRAAAPSAQLTPEQQRLMRELGAQAGGPANSGGPVGSAATRVVPNGSNGGNGAPQDDAARGRAMMRGFEGSRITQTCWQQLLRLNPSMQSRTVTITVSVNGQGRFTGASVSNSPDPRLDSCLRSRVTTIAPIGPGSAMDAQTSVNLTVNQ